MSYASPADLQAAANLYGVALPLNDEFLADSGLELPTDAVRLLALASRDIDAYLGTTWDVSLLDADQVAALRDATCAQGLFRGLQGGQAMLGADDGVASVGALSFRAGAPPRLSPEVPLLLAGLGLFTRSGTVNPDPILDGTSA